MNIKILFICQSLTIKSEWLYRLIENLQDEIKCIATNKPDYNRISWEQENLNPYPAKLIRFISEDINKKFTYPYILKRVEEQYKTSLNYIHFIGFAVKVKDFIENSSNPTVIHCHGKDIMWDLKDRKSGKPVHSIDYFEDLEEISQRVFFIANSSFTQNQLLIKGIPEDRIFINHFGIDIKPLIPKRENGKFKILYLGRLVDVKGPLEVLEAFDLACDRGMEAELIIAGGGEMEKECLEKANSSKYKDRIKLLGWVDKAQAEELYKEVDVFTAHNKKDKYTNQVEAFGVTIIEAMSFGLPVITGNSGGVSDSVIDNATGYLIEPGDIQSHAEKFLQLYNNKELKLEMGAKARNRTIEYFSLKKEKENFHRIIKIINQQHKKSTRYA